MFTLFRCSGFRRLQPQAGLVDVHRRFPSDILGLAKLGGKSGLDGLSVPTGATKLAPVGVFLLGAYRQGGQEKNDRGGTRIRLQAVWLAVRCVPSALHGFLVIDLPAAWPPPLEAARCDGSPSRRLLGSSGHKRRSVPIHPETRLIAGEGGGSPSGAVPLPKSHPSA